MALVALARYAIKVELVLAVLVELEVLAVPRFSDPAYQQGTRLFDADGCRCSRFPGHACSSTASTPRVASGSRAFQGPSYRLHCAATLFSSSSGNGRNRRTRPGDTEGTSLSGLCRHSETHLASSGSSSELLASSIAPVSSYKSSGSGALNWRFIGQSMGHGDRRRGALKPSGSPSR